MEAAQQTYRKYTKEEIERHLTPAGGYLRKDLAAMGVTWPPMKGWKERLMRGEDPNQGMPLPECEHSDKSRHELLEIIIKQQAEIDRLRLDLDEAILRAACLERIA